MHPTLLAHLVLSPGSSCRARRAAKARSEAEAVVVTSSPVSTWLWGAGKKSKYRSTILRVGGRAHASASVVSVLE